MGKKKGGGDIRTETQFSMAHLQGGNSYNMVDYG